MGGREKRSRRSFDSLDVGVVDVDVDQPSDYACPGSCAHPSWAFQRAANRCNSLITSAPGVGQSLKRKVSVRVSSAIQEGRSYRSNVKGATETKEGCVAAASLCTKRDDDSNRDSLILLLLFFLFFSFSTEWPKSS